MTTASIISHSSADTGSSGRRVLGPAWHRRVHDIHVLKVKGSFMEMGRQHGTLLKDAVVTGPIPYYRHFVQRLMGRSLGPLSPLVFSAVQQLVGRRVERGLPPFALETLRGVAEGAGMPVQEFIDGCTMPDALLWLVARMIQTKMRGPAVRHRLALGLGCTSAVAWGNATTDGRLYHARNLDYHGVGNWPSHKAVIFHEPDDGQRYVSVAAAGVALGGITAMNEAGLTLTVHQHMFTDVTTLGGTPIGVVGDIVMRHARNLDDAEAILARNTPIGCWTYVVADGNARQVLCWEESPQRRAARRTPASDTSFGYANVYLDEELGKTEQNLYGSYWRHNAGRHRRTHALLDEKRGSIDAPAMASIIGDRGDPRCRIRDSIAMVMTVGSVVFRPEDGVLWVGDGEAPTSRGTYVPFCLRSEDHDPTERTFEIEDKEAPREKEAFECFRRAYVAYLDDGDARAARGHMERATALCPEQPIYQAVTGLLSLVERDAAAADTRFTAALELGHPDEERVASFHLWRGRTRDVLGRRPHAINDYRAALAHHADAPVHHAARAGLRQAFASWRCSRIHLEFSLGDVITP